MRTIPSQPVWEPYRVSHTDAIHLYCLILNELSSTYCDEMCNKYMNTTRRDSINNLGPAPIDERLADMRSALPDAEDTDVFEHAESRLSAIQNYLQTIGKTVPNASL